MNGMSSDEAFNFIVDKIEEGVIQFMSKKGDKIHKNAEGKNFKSNNHIPRIVRSLFKKKRRDSKLLRKAKTLSRCIEIRKRILKSELELKEFYQGWSKSKEDAIIEKSKVNKNILFRYIKKMNKTKKKVGPFCKEGKIINEDPATILIKQYSSVFSKPSMKHIVNDPNNFFKECWFCSKQWVHICSEDSESNDIGIQNIHISEDMMRKAISKLSDSASSGPDGIPAILLKNVKKIFQKKSISNKK